MNSRNRDILRLAVPALGALLAEPMFLLVDTAMVGHLGTATLAGLGIASTILQTAIGLLIFLAYATTPRVARLMGSGDLRQAVRVGIDGLWIALALGAALLLAGLPSSHALVSAFGGDAAATAAADTYLSISLWGIPAMLMVIAANGLFRGLQDTRTPLWTALAGFGANIVLNAVLIYGMGLGIAGSAIGTVIAQWGMAVAYLIIARVACVRTGATMRPRLAGFSGLAGASSWMFLRTLSLRTAMVLTMMVAAQAGSVVTGAVHIALTVFGLLALALDALAIAAQALVGHHLGQGGGDPQGTSRALVRLGLLSGVVLGAGVAVLAIPMPWAFSTDAAVLGTSTAIFFVMAALLPLAAYVFVLDGVLIGAEDGRYLALTGFVNLACYLPLLLLAAQPSLGVPWTAVWLWLAFGGGYMAARALTLGLRVRGTAWLGPAASGLHPAGPTAPANTRE